MVIEIKIYINTMAAPLMDDEKRKNVVAEIFTRKNMELLAYSIELALRQNENDRYLLERDIKERMMREINMIFLKAVSGIQ